jgi:RNA polymerase sigma-70 factor (ECF subfamily)
MIADATEPSDANLVAQSLAGDDQAFAELARRHHDRIARMVWRFVSQRTEADDVMQEIFLRAWRGLRQFRGEVPFEHWLSRLAIRQCHDLLRRRRRNREDVLEPEQWETLRELAARSDEPPAARDLLALAMRQLSPDERVVITMLELEERSVRETAALTGWSEANVKVRAFRARNKLKSLLEKLDEPR